MDLPSSKIVYRTSKIEGLDIFYREAGPKNAPVVLLLHGFPSSSFMFRNLIPLLADKYHLVAPDFPGYGFSSAPCVNEFEYTFDHFTNVIEGFTEERIEILCHLSSGYRRIRRLPPGGQASGTRYRPHYSEWRSLSGRD